MIWRCLIFTALPLLTLQQKKKKTKGSCHAPPRLWVAHFLDWLGRFRAVSCATKCRAWLAASNRQEKNETFEGLLCSTSSETVYRAIPRTLWHIWEAQLKRELRVIRSLDVERGAFWGSECSSGRKAGVTLASWRRAETSRTALRVGQPRRAGRTAAQPPPAPRGVGAREGACQALRLDAPRLSGLSRSPRWGRPRLSTTSTTRRRRIWWSCLCRRTESLWQTSKMSSRSQTTSSSSNLWTMTSGNCLKGILCWSRGRHGAPGVSQSAE